MLRTTGIFIYSEKIGDNGVNDVLKTAIRGVLWLYLALLVLVILILLPAVNFLAPWYVEREYGRKLYTDIILLNPFNFSVEIRGADLRESDGSPFASLDIARANLSLASLSGRALIFDDITVSGLDIRLRRLGPGEFNFSDFIPPDTGAEAEPEGGTGIPALTIQRLVFNARSIGISDEAREKPFQTHYDNLSVTIYDLSTVLEEGEPYHIELTAEEGGTLRWSGHLSLPGAVSDGHLQVSDFNLVPLWRFAEPWLNFRLDSGLLQLEGDYTVSWKEDPVYRISDGVLEVDAIDLRPARDAELPDTWLALGQLRLSGIDVDGGEQSARVKEVAARGLDLAGWSEGSEVSLAALFDTSRIPGAGPEQEEGEPEDATDTGWTAEIGRLALEESQARWRSGYTEPPVLVLSPLSAELASLRWPLQGDSPLALELVVNSETRLQLSGALSLGAGDGALDYQLDALPLTWINPNLPEALNARITSGYVSVDGNVSLAGFAPSKVNLNGAVTQFSGEIADTPQEEETLTRWDSVRWEQLAVDLDARKVSMQQLVIHDYEGRVHIARDGSVNASKVWREELGDQADEIADGLELDKPWEVDIPEILISASAIDFKDESLPIPFQTVIGDVNGEIRDVSTAPGARTGVDIKGTVDGYAPVSLSGSAEPFSKPPALDLLLTFNGVDLVTLTPYSGTYAGYAIERGLLNLELEYSLEQDRLKGRNDIVINQLKLGEKVDSDKAVNLPLELALALLTDINGVIDLKVPVEGDVDDPEFALGSVIAGALVNLITKAVTAPFALLANLVGSEEDLQRLAFPAGSGELNDPGRAKLDTLAEALAQRPNLTLVIKGQYNLASDRGKLQELELQRQLVSEGLSAESIERRESSYLQAVEKRYRDRFGSPAEGVTFNGQYEAVLGTIDISRDRLRQLEQDRAVAVKDYLVNQGGLSADRAAIEIPGEAAGADGFSGVELDLDS